MYIVNFSLKFLRIWAQLNNNFGCNSGNYYLLFMVTFKTMQQVLKSLLLFDF